MYRPFILLLLCFKTSLSAPQHSDIETIADVKPTIFDYPAVVYDDVSQSYKPAIVNGGRQDSSSDDFSYDITTENVELETTEYADDVLGGYERISEPVQPTEDYENEKKTTRFYSKIGYFLNPYLVENNLNGLGKLSEAEIKQTDYEHSTAVPNNIEVPNNAKDKESYPEELLNIEKENPYSIDGKSLNKTKPIVKKERDLFENETNVGEEKPTYILNNLNRVDSNIENKQNSGVSKQSHFGGSQKLGYTTASLIQKTGKRKFRSNCRCEKIWNCPRLQISVPRCPNEYFMCCF